MACSGYVISFVRARRGVRSFGVRFPVLPLLPSFPINLPCSSPTQLALLAAQLSIDNLYSYACSVEVSHTPQVDFQFPSLWFHCFSYVHLCPRRNLIAQHLAVPYVFPRFRREGIMYPSISVSSAHGCTVHGTW